jgi:hypothetical protein
MRSLLLAALALSFPGASVAGPDGSAEAMALSFCAAVSSRNEAAAEALMTPDLQAAIARLRASDARFRLAYPGDKPPLGDGLRLTAFPDGLESCTPETVTADGVDLVYAPGSDPSAIWRDRLVLVAAPGGGVLVADVLYAPDRMSRFSDWLEEAASWK